MESIELLNTQKVNYVPIWDKLYRALSNHLPPPAMNNYSIMQGQPFNVGLSNANLTKRELY